MAVFSMSDVLRTVSGIILSPVYASSLSRMEGLAFLLSASLHVISLVMLAYVLTTAALVRIMHYVLRIITYYVLYIYRPALAQI